MSLFASNDSYINNSCASVFPLSLLDKNQCCLGVLQVRFEADINACASLAAILWCSPVLASVRLEPNRPCIHLGTGINLPRTVPVVLRVWQTLNYAELDGVPKLASSLARWLNWGVSNIGSDVFLVFSILWFGQISQQCIRNHKMVYIYFTFRAHTTPMTWDKTSLSTCLFLYCHYNILTKTKLQ